MEQPEGRASAYGSVLRFCQKLLGNPADAEDAAQEVFARAAAAGRPDAAEDWLLGIAHHVCMDEHRRRGRADRAMARIGVDPGVEDPEPAVFGPLLESQLLPRLSPAEARLVRHRLRTGANLRQAAEDLGIAASTARALAARVRRKLRPLLPQLGPLPRLSAWLRRRRLRDAASLVREPMLAPAAVAVVVLALGQTLAGPPPVLAAVVPNPSPTSGPIARPSGSTASVAPLAGPPGSATSLARPGSTPSQNPVVLPSILPSSIPSPSPCSRAVFLPAKPTGVLVPDVCNPSPPPFVPPAPSPGVIPPPGG